MTKLEQLLKYKKDTEALGFPVPDAVIAQIQEEENKYLSNEIMPNLHKCIKKALQPVNKKLVFMVELDPESTSRVKIACANTVEDWFDGKYLATIDHSINEELELDFSAEVSPSKDQKAPETRERTRTVIQDEFCDLAVIRPDGSRIERKMASDVLIDTIREIGARKVATLNLQNGSFLTLGKPHWKDEGQLHDVGEGYYVDTHSNTPRKANALQEIFSKLNMPGWIVEFQKTPLNPQRTVSHDGHVVVKGSRQNATGPGSGSAHTNLRVVCADGRVIENQRAIDTLLEVIKLAGPRRVQSMGYRVCGFPFISSELVDNDRYLASQKPLGEGLYALVYNSTEDKRKMIEEISNKFNLSLKVEVIGKKS